MTNADCIRRMSDEQLSEFLSEWECGDIDYSVTFCDLCNEATKRGEAGNALNLDCDGCRRYWLQRDAVDYGGLMYWKRNTTFEADTPQTGTQTETQNSNLTFEIADTSQTDCETCKNQAFSPSCDSCKDYDHYEPQTDCPWK